MATEMVLTHAEQELLMYAVGCAVRMWSNEVDAMQKSRTAPKGVEDMYLKQMAETSHLMARMYSGCRVVFKEASLVSR